MEMHANTQKLNREVEKGHKYAKNQFRVKVLVPIMLDNLREQVSEVSIHSLQ
jgi:hypothetical protein